MALKLLVACTIDHDQANSENTSVSLEVEQDAMFVIDPANLREHVRHLFAALVQALTDDLGAAPNGEDLPPSANVPSVVPTVATATGGGDVVT